MSDNYINLPLEGTGGGGSGVSSLNTLTGALTLIGGPSITITSLGNVITISSTALPTALISLNGSTFANQTLVTGTSGTDFAIVDSAPGIHTFNLPTASAVNRGALSSTDWSTFNSKQSALTFGSISTSTSGVTVGNGSNSTVGPNVTVNIATATSVQNGLLSATDWVSFDSKQPAGSYITSLTTDVVASGPGAVVATIQPNVVTNAKLAQMPASTIKGNNTGVTANAADLTVSQVQTLLSIPTGGSPLPVSSGGTSNTTAQGARSSTGLNIDQRSTFSNANYTVLSTDRYVAQIGTMSAPRTVTLPLASSVNPGQILNIIDESGTVTTTNTITLARAGGDTINGATSSVIRTGFGRAALFSDGVSKWTDAVTGISRGGTGLTTLPTDGQILIGNSTTSAYSLTTLTAGNSISITNAPGSITINAVGINVDGGGATTSYLASQFINGGTA